MNTQSSQSIKDAGKPSLALPFALFAATLLGLAAVVYLLVRPPQHEQEVVLSVVDAGDETSAEEAPVVNTGEIIDTLSGDAGIEIREGARYRVRIFDMSRQGSSGIARIGGMITFVDGVEKGDIAVVEVTRLRSTTAQAALLNVEQKGTAAPRTTYTTRQEPAASGPVLTGTVVRLGSKGDGTVEADGKSIYISGTKIGQIVTYRMKMERDRFGIGELVEVIGTTDSLPEAPAQPPAEDTAREEEELEVRAPHIKPGTEIEVDITERDRFAPEENGVGRVDDNLVIIVPGAEIGEKVLVRITERKERFARSELIKRLPAESETDM